MASIPAGPLPAATFDASAWLAEWSDHGGIVLLVQDRLYLRRLYPIDRAATAALDALRTVMLRSGGGIAIAAELARRRDGNLP